MKARLIGESSAGATIVQIYDNKGDLVWSHRWFERGSAPSMYLEGLCDAWDCMRRCEDYEDFEGCALDESGEVFDFDSETTTGTILEYDSNQDEWRIGGDARRMGQSEEILDACMKIGLVPPDIVHEKRFFNDKLGALYTISKHITEEIR